MKRLWGSTFSVLTMAGLGPPSAALEDDSPTGRLRSGAPRGPSGELEVVAAAGEGSGWTGFGCGGRQMRVRYVVGAIEGRVSSRPVDDPDGAGWTVVGGTALEAGREEIVDEPSQESSIEGLSFPSGTWAVHARFGHHARWIGAEAGVGMVFKWREASPTGHWF